METQVFCISHPNIYNDVLTILLKNGVYDCKLILQNTVPPSTNFETILREENQPLSWDIGKRGVIQQEFLHYKQVNLRVLSIEPQINSFMLNQRSPWGPCCYGTTMDTVIMTPVINSPTLSWALPSSVVTKQPRRAHDHKSYLNTACFCLLALLWFLILSWQFYWLLSVKEVVKAGRLLLKVTTVEE